MPKHFWTKLNDAIFILVGVVSAVSVFLTALFGVSLLASYLGAPWGQLAFFAYAALVVYILRAAFR